MELATNRDLPQSYAYLLTQLKATYISLLRTLYNPAGTGYTSKPATATRLPGSILVGDARVWDRRGTLAVINESSTPNDALLPAEPRSGQYTYR